MNDLKSEINNYFYFFFNRLKHTINKFHYFKYSVAVDMETNLAATYVWIYVRNTMDVEPELGSSNSCDFGGR